MSERHTPHQSATPPVQEADQVTVAGGSTRALPTLPDGSNPREILLACFSGALSDAVSIRPCFVGDTTSAANMYSMPGNSLLRLQVAGFSHIRLDKPSGQTNNPQISISAIS
jgi:hypothetical protein